MEAPEFWLWPDRAITKQESRHLREEHNEAMNQRAELLAALEACMTDRSAWCFQGETAEEKVSRLERRLIAVTATARAAIAKAKGER